MKRNIIKTLAFASVALVFASCLKDKRVERQDYGMINYSGANKIVEIPTSAPGGSSIVNLEFSFVDTTFALVTINLAADQVAQEDVSVTLVSNPTLVANYNSANGTSYTSMPANLFTLNPLTLTIKKGERFGYLMIKGKPSDFASGTYAWGFSLSSVANAGHILSGNYRNVVVIVGVKNRYDGIYQLRGKQLGWLAYNISEATWTYPWAQHMITSGTNSVNMYNTAFPATFHAAQNTTPAWTGFGTTDPRFVFDLTTNKLTNCINDFVGSTRTFKLNPAVTTSRWDPVTKNIYAAILLSQPGRPDLQIFDTLYFVSPR